MSLVRAAAALLLSVAGVAGAQEPVRAGLVGKPRVGQRAPEIVLPYFTSLGPGPVDQPFRLSAELGRVVVLVFGPANADWWRTVAGVADSAWAGAILIGVIRSASSVVGTLASGLPNDRAKLLPDSEGQAGRSYGVRRGEAAAVVVADDGRVARGAGGFTPTAASDVTAIEAAVSRSAPPE